MVPLPGGTYMMGARDGDYEFIRTKPQIEVTIQPFAIAQTETTYGEWSACVADGGCEGHVPSRFGFGDDDRLPVMDVSVDHARAYATWLNSKTEGSPYRLPTESEWEYAARAGTVTRFWWGDEPDPKHARSEERATRRMPRGEIDPVLAPSPVGSFPANPFGLFDMEGNVREWVEGCIGPMESIPRDGSAAKSDGLCRTVLRSSTPISFSTHKASFARIAFTFTRRANHIGFRVAKAIR